MPRRVLPIWLQRRICPPRPTSHIREDIPPNGGYGWVCVICVFMINAHTWGVNSAWGVFLTYYLTNSTFTNATHLEYALIGGLSISQALLISPVVELSRRRLGTRPTLLIGTGLEFVALFAASYATRVWHLFLTQGVCFGCGMGFLYVTATQALTPWFSTKRSLAVGIATSGAGLGGLAYNLVAGQALNTLGIEWSYRVLALSALVANAIFSLLLKSRPRDSAPQPKAFNYRTFGRIEVLLMVFWGTVTEFGYITLLYSLPSYASSIGLSSTQGSVAGALLNLGLGIGRPVIGYYSDRFGRINMAMCMTLLCGVLCFSLWIAASSFPVLLAFALLSGTVCGTFWGTVAAVLADVVGLRNLASTFGIICLYLVVPTTFAEPIAMQISGESSGSQVRQYLNTQIFVGTMFIAGGISLWLLRSWKIQEIEMKAVNERTRPFNPSHSGATDGRMKLSPWAVFNRLFVLKRV